MKATNASCEELCELSEWENAPGASCSLTLKMKCDKTNPMEFGQVRQVRHILKGTLGTSDCDVETERYHTCTIVENCPIDCVPGEWSEWSECTKPCEGCGVEKRKRIGTQHAKYGGNPCKKEDLYEFRECDIRNITCQKKPVCKWKTASRCCYDTNYETNCEITCHTDGSKGKRKKWEVTIKKGSDGSECDKPPKWEDCKGPPCSETVEIFKNYQCSGEPYPVPTDEAILAEFTVQSIEDNENCVTDNEGTFTFDCVRLAKNLTKANQEELEGGRVVFNHQLVNDLPHCCYFKEGKRETINMTETQGVTCLKPLKPSTGSFVGNLWS